MLSAVHHFCFYYYPENITFGARNKIEWMIIKNMEQDKDVYPWCFFHFIFVLIAAYNISALFPLALIPNLQLPKILWAPASYFKGLIRVHIHKYVHFLTVYGSFK